MRKNKFQTTLAGLLNSPVNRNAQKKIAHDAGVSPSSLTQYKNGSSNPTIETLVLLAEALGVSLDFLITGQDFQSTATGFETNREFSDYVDVSLTRILAQTDRRSWLSSRIALQLQKMIDRAAQDLSSEGRLRAIPGLLDDNICAIIEGFSKRTRIYNTFFHYSFAVDANGGTPGKFFDIISDNLQKKRSYQYLFAPGKKWEQEITGFHKALLERIGFEGAHRCEMLVATQAMLSGLGLYELDIVELQRAEPIAWEMIADYTDKEGRFAYIIPPTTNIHGDLMFPRENLEDVFKQFDHMWDTAKRAKPR